ncbi:MAG: ABC transporter ATP-binding protein [Dehalococcoidia bacterium]
MEYAIETESLTKQYRKRSGLKRRSVFTALDGVSLKIRKGEVVGYLGPNGAGKTTTIKILTKLIRPTSGRAYVNGVNVAGSSQEFLRHVGTLIEVPGIYEYLTPHEMLTYFAKVHRIPSHEIDSRIRQTLGLLNLLDWEHQKTGTFSTGMQRRLALAKAILHRPEILILDEPVLGLDPQGIRDIRELIRQFKSDGMTVFLSSHLLGEVAEVCDMVIFLDKGKVVRSAGINDIVNSSRFKAVKVKFAKPLSGEELHRIRSLGMVKDIRQADGVVRIEIRGEAEASYQILRELAAMGFDIFSYNPDVLGLEDYYISIVGDERNVK